MVLRSFWRQNQLHGTHSFQENTILVNQFGWYKIIMANFQCVLSHYCTSFHETIYKGTNTWVVRLDEVKEFFVSYIMLQFVLCFVVIVCFAVQLADFSEQCAIFCANKLSGVNWRLPHLLGWEDGDPVHVIMYIKLFQVLCSDWAIFNASFAQCLV